MVYFDASTPHSYQCVGKKPAGALIVTMHQAPGQGSEISGQVEVEKSACKPTHLSACKPPNSRFE